jgi:hypothetical protein
VRIYLPISPFYPQSIPYCVLDPLPSLVELTPMFDRNATTTHTEQIRALPLLAQPVDILRKMYCWWLWDKCLVIFKLFTIEQHDPTYVSKWGCETWNGVLS